MCTNVFVLIFDFFALDDRRRMKVKLKRNRNRNIHERRRGGTQNVRAAWATLFFSVRNRAGEREREHAELAQIINERRKHTLKTKRNGKKPVKTADESYRVQSNWIDYFSHCSLSIVWCSVQFDGIRVASSADYSGTTWNYCQIPSYFQIFSIFDTIWIKCKKKKTKTKNTHTQTTNGIQMRSLASGLFMGPLVAVSSIFIWNRC